MYIPDSIILVGSCGKEVGIQPLQWCGASSVLRDMLSMPFAPCPTTGAQDQLKDTTTTSTQVKVKQSVASQTPNGANDQAAQTKPQLSAVPQAPSSVVDIKPTREVSSNDLLDLGKKAKVPRLTVAEDAEVITAISQLLAGKTVDFPANAQSTMGRNLAASLDKYDMFLLRPHLLHQLRVMAAAGGTEPVPTGATDQHPWIAFVTAAHMNAVDTMVACLAAKIYNDPDTWPTWQAALLPLPVFCALIRAWSNWRTWEGMIKAFPAEYANKGPRLK